MAVILWHNPRCSKSRQTLALLLERGVEVEPRLYLETPPTKEELGRALELLGKTPSQIIRKGEALFKDLGLQSADEAALLEAMIQNPKLIERPILFANGKAAIGRPPEAVLDIL